MKYVEHMIDFLKTATDEDWMYVACDVNYDEGLPLIEWMVAQERCPKSAALAIYWLLNPAYIKSSTSAAFAADRRVLAIVEENYPQNYRSSELGFDPTGDVFADSAGHDWTSQHGSTDGIPAVMLEPVDGLKLVHKDSRFGGWLECRPPHLLDA